MTASTSTRTRVRFHTLTVAEVERLCADAVAVSFDVPAELASDYAFRPGQSVVVRRTVDGREQRRNYSICAPAGARPRIGVREIAGGEFSPWLVHRLRPGERLEVSTPTGSFTPDTASAAHHVLVVAGAGITPALSIAASVLADGRSTVTLLYGNRRSDTVMFADELADLKDRYPERFELVHVLSREPRESELLTGRLDGTKLRELVPELMRVPEVDHWWLCGPFGMVTEAEGVLDQWGVPGERVHHELFYVGEEPPEPERHVEQAMSGASTEVTVILDGRSTTTAVSRETPILDGAQRSRPDLPFACKGGVCGTCRAKLVDGTGYMRRNFALEQSEVDDGFVLTCQTLPTSERVTVDYDT
ncbi:ring-1,2-phenylacetyl-CoA epoxidase subunit PaaE [Haloechinothrix alba]|uniref:Ring-1,2-phenylacetyl-CoA epoxidase subunit PaaE n=1 Tax=Haloechinothrix alba TaxID=664784 RepID=A0A238WRL3_9PSEU|nr:1,2-phenylacetyl-CoA epoxidase subunit PaaE [Haloechinothrix alba]SNR49196.1 ring-1,2-phenylacetyl-CoA epoxidase subunit PaaE [Haloechinothrix alba]